MDAELKTEWAIVEVFGHRSYAGRISEIDRFGAKFVQIEVPKEGTPDGPWETVCYGGASIFSIRASTKDEVMAANKPFRWASPRLLPRSEQTSEPEDGVDDEAGFAGGPDDHQMEYDIHE